MIKHIPFVKEDEILIILCDDEEGDLYIGPIENSEEVLDLVDNREAVQRLLRLDLTTLHADDVSESVADIYVALSDMAEKTESLQPFIVNSEAYHDYLEQQNKQAYHDTLYGSYEQQHRLRFSDVLSAYDHLFDEQEG
ncbi:hypothetical protein X471_00783 [Bartonella bacilliformis str. Heidi Mejia]|uniref:Uncharacterized protein n=2 Tax=Bartonella bacilliformis TaxID=774 RepID=A1URC7_BARBK|nr:hypothetical protein [Bartonella bacilliformis]ABM44489.1 conserved hypothetical protein [Bartonella bacilliformis KC583]AMG85404.1 hypothetical protein AL467_01050 [Bartonella bacilliformis]EKS46080.1 hypothetical protein BbINS_00920 [Bartonella bacilliformis INS]EYS89159.1 hypothetical protein X472_00777 [Bartonella bacilliformis San Pedro600-02]EYS91380.1 hypothetical protein X471_00783 [Bartonella bacilliformis str. Heidi Mejia]